MFLLKFKLKSLIIMVTFAMTLSLLVQGGWALCIGTSPASCLTELSEEEANETLKYVISKYEEVEMKIIGEPVSIYGLRVSYGDVEEELNIHFKYIDNTQYDIIQNCVFVLKHRQNECELIKTICNTFLPITPRPLLQRKDLRICTDDGSGVQVVEKEETEDNEATAGVTVMTVTDAEQIRTANNGEQDAADDDDDEENNSDEVEDADGQARQRMSVKQRIVSETVNK